MTIRLDGRVAIVTGAGQGLGRCHALALASRGAKVLVNDLGGARDGTGQSSEQAESVVAEIIKAGGEAVANGANVAKSEQVEQMVAQALSEWGRVDILVNNAGILRDKSFAKMTAEEFRTVIDVHLIGSFNCTKAVWDIMREQHYGRIVFTTSSSGLYGNFGQANYGAAKMGVIGLMNTLHLEGTKYDIRVNALAPAAATRMTEDIFPKELFELFAPESVSPGIVFLCGPDAPSRKTLAAGAGSFAVAKIYETDGINFSPADNTPEAIAESWHIIDNPSEQQELPSGGEQAMKFGRQAALTLGIDLSKL
jgi:NAD(P)-dependent dehydrogenase (short-subunit alcohol dehydrogenase family)